MKKEKNINSTIDKLNEIESEINETLSILNYKIKNIKKEKFTKIDEIVGDNNNG